MNCNAVRELLEEYALGALDAETQQAVEQHLHGCPDCLAALNEYAEVVALLPVALSAVSPHRLPTSLKAHLLETLVQQAAASATPAGQLTSPSPPATARAHTGTPARMASRARIDWSLNLWRMRVALIAATVLLVLLAVWTIRLNVALARERALRAEFMDLVGHQQELVLEVVDSNQTTRRILRPPAGDSRAYGKLFTREGLTHVVAMAARLPIPPEGEAYHLWLTHNGSTELAGLLAVNDGGFGLLIHEADTDSPEYDAAQVTLQPTGSATPAGEPVLVWNRSE